MVRYLSTDPNAGLEPAKKYLSMDPMAGMEEAESTPISRAGAQVLAPINAQAALDALAEAGRIGMELPGATVGVLADYTQGALKGLGRMAAPVVKAVGLGNDYTDAALAPENGVEGLGGTAAQVGASALATAATGVLGKGAGLVSKVARGLMTPIGQGATAAAVTKASGGSNYDAAQNALIFGGLGKAAAGARPIPTGKGAIKPLPDPIPVPKPTSAHIKAAVEAGPRGNAAKQAMRMANKPTSAPAKSVAEEAAERAARQKEHIAESYAKKASKEAKNVEESANLEERLLSSLKPKSQELPKEAVNLAEQVKARVLSMKKQGMSRGQMKASVLEDLLRRRDGFRPADVQRAVDLILKETK